MSVRNEQYLTPIPPPQIKLMHYKDWEAKVAANDPEYVPRQAHYREAFCKHMDELLGDRSR